MPASAFGTWVPARFAFRPWLAPVDALLSTAPAITLVANHVECPGECPDTTIEPHHLGDFLTEIGSRAKVEFESAEFNKKWRVLSVDAKAAYDRIDQSTIEFLNESHLTPAIEFLDGLLIIRVHHPVKDPAAHERLIRWVERFSAAVPDDLMTPVKLLPPVRS